MNQILAALLNAQPAANAASSSSSTQAQDSSSSDASSTAQFKSQFDQAVQTLAIQQANAKNSAQGSTTTQGAAQATTAGSAVQSAQLADSLQEALQKKIADLLAKGETVSEIVQQLAASLAASLAQQFGGDQTQIQNQLQTAFASALTLPVNTGPPLSSTDLASALAQRFRQVADVAAGVLGETGQSNRIFAGSNLDTATTVGVQPAPTTTTPATPVPNVSAADSMADDAKALLASLTASQGDGKTVATTNGAQNVGSNGDTLLGRILARAQQAQTPPPAPSSAAQTPAPLTLEKAPAQSSVLTAMALAQASVALGTPAAPTTSAPDPTAVAVQRIVANVDTASPVTTETPITTAAPAPLNPAVVAFLKSFSDALTSTSTAPNGKSLASDTDPSNLLTTTVSSAQAPTIGAFAPVQAAVQNDAVSTSGSQSSSNANPSQTTADPYHVVDQLITGVFMNTTGDASTVRLRLQPESLGEISVRLTVQGDSVSATVMAQTPQAHDALVAGQQQLTRALADAGLKLSSFSVDLAGGFASFQQQQQQNASQNGSSSGRNGQLGGVDTTETDDTALPAASPVGPPVLTGVDWSALNYLV
jgi:flagellar hook-length control protein FliK